jgi:deoxyribonuclease V
MIWCMDVDYREDRAVVAGLGFRAWTDGAAAASKALALPTPGAYEPGQFYKRELPCLLALLTALAPEEQPELIVVDGYVWLGQAGEKGLGAHLSDALAGRIPVVGVAKTAYQRSPFAEHVVRGEAKKPLYVTAQGLPAADAAAHVRSMAGPFRVPTLLQQVDRLCRDASPAIGRASFRDATDGDPS